MASEALLEWTMTGLETATGHLNQVFEESLVAGKEKETELLVVSSFFKEFALVEKRYKEGLVKLVLKYQKQVHETLNDEKMMQYFQMMFNNLLVKSDLVEKRQDFFGSFQKKLVALDLNFRNKVQTRIDAIQVEKDVFRRKLDSYRLNFGEYLRMCDSYNKYCVDKIDMYQSNYERLQDFKRVLEGAEGFEQQMKVVSEIIGYKYDIGAKDAKKIKMKFTVKHRKEKLSRAEVDRFGTYFETLRAKSKTLIESKMQSMKQMQKKVNGGTDLKIEEQSRKMEKRHRIVEGLMFDLLKRFRKTLKDCSSFELAWKEKIKAQMLQFMCGYFVEKQDEILAKAEVAERSFEPFTSRYAYVARDNLLPHNDYLNLDTLSTHFMEYNIFGHMRRHIENPTQSTILTKFFKKRKHIEDHRQLLVVMVLDTMFTSPKSFTPEIMRRIHELMQEPSHRIFMQNAFLARKVFNKYENQGGLERMSSGQVKNFAFFLRRIFEKQAERTKVNEFLMYSLLRFASIVETEQKETLIQRLRDFPLVDQPSFWKQILLYMSKYIYRKLNKRKQKEESRMVSGSNKLIQKLGGFFNRGLSPVKEKVVKRSHIKSFEDVSALLFRMELGFEQIVDILLNLAAMTGIKAGTVRTIMVRNKEVLLSQLELLNAVPLTREELESLKNMQTYDRVIRQAKGLTPRKSFHLKVISDPQINALKKCFEENKRTRVSKLIDVIKWSLPYLVGKYDASGWRHDIAHMKAKEMLEESIGALLERVVEEDVALSNYKAGVEDLVKVGDVGIKNDFKPRNVELNGELKLSRSREQTDSPEMRKDRRGSQASKRSSMILASVRGYDGDGIDEFLESATIISQRSRKPSPDKSEKDVGKGVVKGVKKKANFRDWKDNYTKENNPQGVLELKEILELLLLNREMYLNHTAIIKKILTRIWPLSGRQRKYLYFSLVNPGVMLKKPLFDYETYSFPPLSSPVTSSSHLELGECEIAEGSKREFGESFMMSPAEMDEHLSGLGLRSVDERRTLGNDFAPELKGEERLGLNLEMGLGDTLEDDSFMTMVRKEQRERLENEELGGGENGGVGSVSSVSLVETEKSEASKTSDSPTDTKRVAPMKRKTKAKMVSVSHSKPEPVKDFRRNRSRPKLAKGKNPFRGGNDLPTKKPKKVKKKVKKLKPLDKDHIIALDVKRTHAERADFDHLSLEQILRNVNHTEMGRFSYYQGLNYIVAYLLDVMGDKERTYCLTIRLLESEFRQYVDENMENLSQLFYMFRRILHIFLPRVSHHLERNENMQTSVIYANWFLTIFTTLKQQKKHIPMLDQIFDIFVSKGWAGFFRCILVLLYHCEDTILSLRNDELIVFLTDFARKGFQVLGERFEGKKRKGPHVGKRRATQQIEFDKQELAIIRAEKVREDEEETRKRELESAQKKEVEYIPKFDFKREIKMFDAVNKLLLVEFRMEYHSINEAYEKKWVQLIKKVDSFK